jgi:phosphatidylglycerol:prolipoprotein diacylglycerol transferase
MLPLLYPLTLCLGLVLSAWAWERLPTAHTPPTARQRHVIYVGALLGMVLGAKLAYLLAEGHADLLDPLLDTRSRALRLLQGKSVTGALLGGYAGVELAKRKVGYPHATGDSFALIAPFSLAVGRLGCLAAGCCLGVPMPPAPWTLADQHGVARWPAVPLELAFNVSFFAWVVLIAYRRRRSGTQILQSQLFHVYLLAYGVFRSAHELLRDTPKLWGPVSGYQLLALGLIALGTQGYLRVQRRSREVV